jgi:hypothetical protein
MPKPAMPCSVNGVLNTRSRPGQQSQYRTYALMSELTQTKLFSKSLFSQSTTVGFQRLTQPTMVHRNTPPKATSSPNMTALSSFINAILNHKSIRCMIEVYIKPHLIASRTAWYVFICRVSRPPTIFLDIPDASSSAHARPGVRSAVSRVVRRIWEVAIEGRWPPAGGGSAELELQRRDCRNF